MTEKRSSSKSDQESKLDKLQDTLEHWESLFDKHLKNYHKGDPSENCDSCRMFIQKIQNTQAEIGYVK